MFSAPTGVTPLEFCKELDTLIITRLIVLPCGEETMTIF